MIALKKTIILGTIVLLISALGSLLAADEAKDGVVYKYKKYERFDLGNLEVKGEILAPGDLSILERERKVFNLQLMDRQEFDEEMIQNIIFLR